MNVPMPTSRTWSWEARSRPPSATCGPNTARSPLLRHVEGYSYKEIAEIMELPLGTVKTYIHRARLELKEALAHLEV